MIFMTTQFPPDYLGRNQYVDTNVAFDVTGETAYVVTAVASSDLSSPRSYLNIILTDPSLPSASTLLRSNEITLDVRSRRNAVNFTGTVVVMDENHAPISGAAVSVEWTLPDGTALAQSGSSSGTGEASFKVSGEGGIYTLTVTDISKGEYLFDPDNSTLSAARAWF